MRRPGCEGDGGVEVEGAACLVGGGAGGAGEIGRGGADGAQGGMVGDTGDDTAAGAVGFGGAKKTRGALVLALGEGEKSEGVERVGRAPAVAEIDPYEQALAEMRVSLGETTEDGGVHAHAPRPARRGCVGRAR